jgi:putative glycosyltransferase (TIGR04372 family)
MKIFKKFSKTYFKNKNRILHFILTSLIYFLNLLINKDFSRPEPYYGNYLLGLNLLPMSGDKYFELDAAWNKTYLMFNKGEYQNGVRIRKEIMSEIYERNGITNCDYFPPVLSKWFTGPIGHHQDIGVHIAAQNLGLIPSGQRYLQVAKKDLNKPFYASIKESIKLLSFSNLHNSDEPPGLWHIYERMQLVKTHEGFIDHLELAEKVYINHEMKSNEPILKLDSGYIQKSILELKNYGLKESDWFVTLHVRDAGNPKEHNSQSISNYIKSVEYIIKAGGKVIRIGDSSMPRVPDMPSLIDLSQNSITSSHLHLYALAAAKFFLGTQSGPKSVPPLFSVPSLITNMTHIGNTTFCSKNTLYIPKNVYINKQRLSFTEIINSQVGYGSFRPIDMHENKILFEPNTEEQILSGVKEMINIVFNKAHPRNFILDNKVDEIRKQVNFATTGLFSAQWLEENQTWFLFNA